MKTALDAEFDKIDVCIMAAAVSDYRPVKPLAGKKHREKDDGGGPAWSIDCTANPDIVAALGAKKTKQFLVGFSLETNKDLDRARAKMKEKKCDMMVVNTASSSLETDTTSARVLFPDVKDKAIAECPKQEAAEKIIRLIAERMKK